MNDKIVFIDIDGTLFDNEKDIIHPSTIDAIRKLKEKHIPVIIASGRSQVMGDEVFKRFDLEFDGYILINGQYVIYEDDVVFKNPLDKKFINDYIKLCEHYEIPYGFLTNEDTFVSSYDHRVVDAFKDFKIKLPRLMNEFDLNDDIYQALFFDLNYITYFSQNFKEYVKFITWKGNGADIISNQASKAVGMKIICEKLGISNDNVYAFGDSSNDIEMIQYAKYGIAMGNAKDELKEVASYVTESIDKDGFYNALKKFNLI